jgi:hypothetical protein
MADDTLIASPSGEPDSAADQLARHPVVVGIGASAGGVQTLQTLFEALPDKTGAAFVVVVHLDPHIRSHHRSPVSSPTMRDPAIPSGIGQWGAIQAAAPSFGVEVSPINVREDAGEIERAVAAFARASNCGLILTGSALAGFHRSGRAQASADRR